MLKLLNIVRGCLQKKVYANTFENLGEIDIFLEKYKSKTYSRKIRNPIVI